jgi:hypothetical protein
VYGWSADRAEVLTVHADKKLLGLTTTPKAFDIARQPDLEIVAHVFDRARRSWPFCTDVGMPGDRAAERWTAISGVVTIVLSPPGIRARAPFLYRATIQIVGAEFVGPTGIRIRQTRPITLTAVVGSYIG